MNRILARRLLVLPLLTLGLTLATMAAVHVPAGQASTSASLQINFGSTPHWGYVPGTQVREIQQGAHPQYDVFRYGSTYYAYDNNRWYSSSHSHGTYRYIDEKRVPSQFRKVPANRWKHYPSGWQHGNGNNGHGNNGHGDNGHGDNGQGQQPGGNDHH